MTQTTLCYGATKEEWAHFDMVLGITSDLLPVVSNTGAEKAPDSKLNELGKVPSVYNQKRQVVGLSGWTQRIASYLDMERWVKERDYGICIQTREVRALDLDIPDPVLCAQIVADIRAMLPGVFLAERYRENSSKTLLAFVIPGNMPKRVIRVRDKVVNAEGLTIEPAWLIEFLATGQQFIAAGTHGSGARIQWRDGLPEKLTRITTEQFEAVWKMLTEKYAVAKPSQGAIRKRGEYIKTEDTIAELISEKGLVLDTGNDGQLFITCPWKDGHSIDSGVSETAYFPRGTGGYAQGHFKCMHAGCAEKDDADFEEKLGLRDSMFEAVVIKDKAGNEVQSQPAWSRDGKGRVEANLYNLRLALERPDICNVEIKFDEYLADEVARNGPDTLWRALTDDITVHLREHLERRYNFKQIGKELMRDAIIGHGARHRFDSAIDWLEGLPAWDGIPRIAYFMHEHMHAENTPYSRAVGEYLWTALAGRVLVPGIKADMALILQGDQGLTKSTAISSLAPCKDWYAEIGFGGKEEDLVRKMRGKVVLEIGELRGFYSKEFEVIKAFIVRQYDQIIPKYRERAVTMPRRSVLVGTTNHAEFLIDDTGNRRFLPIKVGKIDSKLIRKDALQLWAEARDMFLAGGIAWKDAEELAKNEHEQFMVHDSWEDDIITWLKTKDMSGQTPVQRPYIKTSDVLREALNIDSRTANPGLEKRAAKALKALGFDMKRVREEGRNLRVYVKA